MALIWRDDHLTAGAWATCGMIGDRKVGKGLVRVVLGCLIGEMREAWKLSYSRFSCAAVYAIVVTVVARRKTTQVTR